VYIKSLDVTIKKRDVEIEVQIYPMLINAHKKMGSHKKALTLFEQGLFIKIIQAQE